MAFPSGQPMYENGSLSRATGDETLRPGGLDLTERMLALCDFSVGDLVLDVGCGTASTIRYLLDVHSVHPIGIDRSEPLLRTGITGDPRLPLVCACGSSLPLTSGKMNAILAECSLSAMGDTEKVVAEFRRVLHAAGRLALSDIYARNPDGCPGLHALPLSCGLRNALTQDELIAHLQTHGFEIIAWEDHSEMLKYLAAQMILAHGSMTRFWCHAESAADPADIQAAIREAKLGYYLLVARKI